MVRRGAVVVPRFIAFCVECGSLGIQSTDWLEEKKERKVRLIWKKNTFEIFKVKVFLIQLSQYQYQHGTACPLQL